MADRPLAVGVSDLDLVDRLSGGRVDLTYGRRVWLSISSLLFRILDRDIFQLLGYFWWIVGEV